MNSRSNITVDIFDNFMNEYKHTYYSMLRNGNITGGKTNNKIQYNNSNIFKVFKQLVLGIDREHDIISITDRSIIDSWKESDVKNEDMQTKINYFIQNDFDKLKPGPLQLANNVCNFTNVL